MKKRHELNGTVYYAYHENKKLPTIIMVHGFRGTHHGLDLIAEHLTGFHVIVPDLPGFGESQPLTDEHSVANYVKWLKKFTDDLKLPEKPIVVGHSFGTIVTSNFASQYPETLSKLVLINPIGAPALKGPKAVLTQLALAYYWLGRKLPEKTAIKLLNAKPIMIIMSNAMAKTKDKTLLSFIYDQHIRHFGSFANRKILNEAFKASINNTVRDIAANVKVPVLIIAGELDDITPINKQRELVALFPSASIEVIARVGHLIPYETPGVVAKIISDFTI